MALIGVGIRRALEPDFEALTYLMRDRADTQGSHTHLQSHSQSHWQAEWQDRIRSPEVFTYLVEDEEVFGFVTAGPSLLLEDQDGELLGLYLKPDHRGAGMGKKLLVRGLSVLKRRNFTRAVVFVENQDVVMMGVLTSLGFDTGIGEREINHSGGTILQVGLGLDLKDYF